MNYLLLEDILQIHSFVIDETTGGHGIRDKGSLLALIELPKQEAFGVELYPTVYKKAAVYIRNIIFAHPFIDGNKRSAMACADVFLQLNGLCISFEKWKVEKFALSVIEEHLDIAEIAAWFKENTEAIAV
jgi:death on curing protein